MTNVYLHFRLIGEKIGNVGRGINIAIVNCKLLNIFFKTFLKTLMGFFPDTLGFRWFLHSV